MAVEPKFCNMYGEWFVTLTHSGRADFPLQTVQSVAAEICSGVEIVQEVENKLNTSINILNDVTENMLRESAEMFIYLRKAKQIVII